MKPFTPLLNLKKPTPKDTQLNWPAVPGCAESLAIHELALDNKNLKLIITENIHHARQLRDELYFFSEKQYPVHIFPDWETLPYDHFSPHQDIISRRLETLNQLTQNTHGVILVSINTLMQRLLPQEYLLTHSFVLKTGDSFNLESIKSKLAKAGYRNVNQVMEHGEFSSRGSIFDIFPMGSNTPFRIDLFDDEVDSIRIFDPSTQRSTDKINSIRLLPAREYPLSDDGITQFRKSWRELFSGNPKESSIYNMISEGEAANGAEYYSPLFYDKLSHFFAYLPENTTCLLSGNIKKTADIFWHEVKERYDQLRWDITRPLCSPESLFLNTTELFTLLKPFQKIHIARSEATKQSLNQHSDTRKEIASVAHTLSQNIAINHRAKMPLEKLHGLLQSLSLNRKDAKVLFTTDSLGRREALLELLKTIDIKPKPIKSWHEFSAPDIYITVSPINTGVIINDNTVIISETELFGEVVKQTRKGRKAEIDPNLMIKNLTELSIGAPVVHIDHGVGRYLGLNKLTTGEVEAEYLTLEYANKDKIYVPVSSLHLINRYTGMNADNAPLQKLGSGKWDKTKEEAFNRIRDTAAELLDIYARRHAKKGFTFKKPDKDFTLFRQAFPFEETPDQAKAINDVISDMTQEKMMERLVCGDVGFGKTEVAMQAAYLATQSNKQVAILVPTTLLANQHAANFADRFADWPIKVACLTRLITAREQNQILAELATGKIDILIGTHKLLNEKIQYKNLGLLIVDEEHRFGVRQKEKIKAIAANIDILTLTATPIPRTLNMALAGTRDLSIIATPPARRLSVKTFVHEYSEQLIREAVLRESLRGGQVYFLHNEVATIEATAEKLKKIIPEARVAIAHGQLREHQMEKVMADFYHQRFNLLVCSTIVESGIDVPTANTMIINRADKLGLAQLHQIRGRVGRSHHQAYAYLLTPPKKQMTKDAQKRLEAIEQLEGLGVGFNLANHDLEIRGAGELLGDEQSGQMEAIGFTLYMELLEEAVNALKQGKTPQLEKPLSHQAEIDLGITALLPENYIHDVHERLTLYKRLANANSHEQIKELKIELIDRFGLLPEAALHLLTQTELKLISRKMGINKIEMGKQFGYLHFNEKPNVDPKNIIKLIQLDYKNYQLQGASKLRFTIKADIKADDRIKQLNDLLAKLQ